MYQKDNTIVFVGAGAIGTALGNLLAMKNDCRVILHSVEEDVVNSINNDHLNPAYFPSIPLTPSLKATQQNEVLNEARIIFLAIPSGVVIDYLVSLKNFIHPDAILVNLAKGFGNEHRNICETLRENFSNPVCALKGPTFAREIINQLPTGFTLGFREDFVKDTLTDIFDKTTVHLDYTHDITGVEILSILKNIYAIVLGIVDAQFDSPNLRFLVLTKAFREMRKILLHFQGDEATLFRYCGYGDFTLTALNDLSRNRTLGLLIGKGFFSEQVSHELVLEGKKAVIIFYEELSKSLRVEDHFPLVAELYKIFTRQYPVSSFVSTILSFEDA
jgi:glycerol-3-phosphate dehydrogenase (NAD(P)+)